MLAAMRTLAWLLLLATFTGCAYQRYTTPVHAAPDVKLSSKDRPAQMYTFRLISADVPPTKISGLTWDDDGSGPDPFARLYVDNRLVWESPVIENQTRPEWNIVLPANVLIPSNSKFRLELLCVAIEPDEHASREEAQNVRNFLGREQRVIGSWIAADGETEF